MGVEENILNKPAESVSAIYPKEKPMAIVKPHQENREIVDKMMNDPDNGSFDKEKFYNTDNVIEDDSTDKKSGESVTMSSTTEEEEDMPPAKGYNLDLLDNLDDPNFNPF